MSTSAFELNVDNCANCHKANTKRELKSGLNIRLVVNDN